jgi:hypothetical protein
MKNLLQSGAIFTRGTILEIVAKFAEKGIASTM